MELPVVFYRYWAQIAGWNRSARVWINVLLLSLVLYLIARLTFRLWRTVLLKAGIGLIHFRYGILVNRYYDKRITNAAGTEYKKECERYNAFCGRLEHAAERKNTAIADIKNRKFQLYWLFVIAGLLLLLIWVPGMAGISKGSVLYTAAGWYDGIEQKYITQASAFPPFYTKKEKPEKEESSAAQDEIVLRLNQEGIAGSKLREGPGMEYDVVTIISGEEVRMRPFEEQENDGRLWRHVTLEDGTKGWISNKLVEEISDEE